jgi:hypothetical protein
MLTVTGGFAGVYQNYQLEGALGLSLDRHPHPPETIEAQFGSVAAKLHGDGFFDGEDLDRLLRMTAWHGQIVHEDTLSFTGTDSQKAPITAIAEFTPARLHLRGENQPECCDFFNFSWDLFALNPLTDHGHAHSDFDEDGNVDGDDLLDALANFGLDSGALHSQGDADADSDVDHMDLTIWKTTVGKGVTAYAPDTAPIPEPATFMLAILPVVLLVIGCRVEVA